MSNLTNTSLIEHAIALAEEWDEIVEDPSYIEHVAQLVRASDLDGIRELIAVMTRRLAYARKAGEEW